MVVSVERRRTLTDACFPEHDNLQISAFTAFKLKNALGIYAEWCESQSCVCHLDGALETTAETDRNRLTQFTVLQIKI